MLAKKTVAIIIALVTILSLVLSACGGGAKAQPITLRIGWGQQHSPPAARLRRRRRFPGSRGHRGGHERDT